MTWTHINSQTRLVALLCGIVGMVAAWMLLRISKSGPQIQLVQPFREQTQAIRRYTNSGF